MNSKAIGEKLKKLRGKKSMREVADAVGVAPTTICMYESGERVPKDEIKVRLAKYFNSSVEDIFFAEQVHDMCT